MSVRSTTKVDKWLLGLLLCMVSLGYVSLTQHHLFHQLTENIVQEGAQNLVPAPQKSDQNKTGDNVNESCLHCLLNHFFSADIPHSSRSILSRYNVALKNSEIKSPSQLVILSFDSRGPPLLI